MAPESEFGAEETQDDPMVGEAPAGDENPGEPVSTPNDGPIDTDVQDSNPNAAGPARLQGDMGISSERTGPFGAEDSAVQGIEGTGSVGSSAAATDGTLSTTGSGDTVREHAEEPAEGPDMEEANDQVPSHDFDAGKNPGHSHG